MPNASPSTSTGASRRKTPATRAAARPRDAIALLKADHAEVKKMHRQYEKLADENASAARRGALATKICQALTAHATAEEEIFYPAARAVLDEQDLVDHADVEHASAKDLIAQIAAMDPKDSHYDAKVLVLCEYVAHHVKEEEKELFPACRRTRALDLKQLGAEIAARKAEVLAQLKARSSMH